MAASSFVLASLLMLYVSSIAFAFECPMCSNAPGMPGVPECGSDKAGDIKCQEGLDRCMTVTGKMTIPGVTTIDFVAKNCSNILLCDPGGDFNMCKIFNSTGVFTSCSLTCTKPNGGVRVLGITASLCAVVLLVFIWNLI